MPTTFTLLPNRSNGGDGESLMQHKIISPDLPSDGLAAADILPLSYVTVDDVMSALDRVIGHFGSAEFDDEYRQANEWGSVRDAFAQELSEFLPESPRPQS
jgi:hypothetical protein